MVGQGAASSEESIFDEGSTGQGVIRIAAVAALGGFLFGYDSAVINGAVAAVGRQFDAQAASLGFAVASACSGLRRARSCPRGSPNASAVWP